MVQKIKKKELSEDQQQQLAEFQSKQKKNINKVFEKSDISRLDYRMKLWSGLTMLGTLVEVVVGFDAWWNRREISGLIMIIASFPVFALAFMAYFNSSYKTLKTIGKAFVLFGVLGCFANGVGGIFLIILGAVLFTDASRALVFYNKENAEKGEFENKKALLGGRAEINTDS